MAVQGYLPSELSPHIKATLRRSGAGHALVLEAEGNARSSSPSTRSSARCGVIGVTCAPWR
jgi:hypothetical protein